MKYVGLPSRRVAASQLALVEPNLDARRLKGRADALCRIGILRGVAEEDSPPRSARRRGSVSAPPSRSLLLSYAGPRMP
jgi:hypothetical protein